MTLTKNAIGNLVNRYKAVLAKCRLLNTLGSLAVASALVLGMGGAGMAADSGLNWSDGGSYTSWHSPRNPTDPHQAGIYAPVGDASGANVHIDTGSGTYQIYGGYAVSTYNANNNSVTMTGGQASEITGGSSADGNANNNTVSISGGIVVGEVVGGQVNGATGNANYNTVIISGGIVGDVAGGQASTTNGHAIGNTVIYSGGSIGGDLSGGMGPDGSRTDNTLVSIDNRTVGGDVDSFQNYRFVLGGNNVGLTVGGWFAMDDTTNKLLQLDALGGGSSFNVGDKLTLVQAGQIDDGAGITAGQTGRGKKGATLFFDYAVDPINTVPNSLTATVTGVQVNPQAKALSEGVAASMAFLNMGADAVASAGMASALASTAGVFPAGTTTIAPFGTIQFGSSRIDTGSHVNVTGLNLIAGIALGQQTEFGKFLIGPFFEAGFGTYNTYNSFDNAATVTGDGKTNFLGAGLLARFDSSDIALGHLYVEGSFRFGHAFHDYNADDLKDVLGNTATYDSDAPYQSFHAGLGYIFNLTESDHLDVYGKYFWSHLGKSDVRVVGDPIEFKDVYSSRLRFGGRYSHDFGTDRGYSFSPYIGAAYEHEFDGKVRATTYGYSISRPSLTGDTGVGELGVTFSHKNGFSLDLGVSGHVGTRQGVAGNMLLKYEF